MCIAAAAMSDPYERAKGGRLSFKGGVLATRTTKSSIDKKKKKKTKQQQHSQDQDVDVDVDVGGGGMEKEEEEGGIYTIDAAKRRKYDELFPVEAKKFGYDPNFAASNSKSKSVEEALDDRVKKKADRYILDKTA